MPNLKETNAVGQMYVPIVLNTKVHSLENGVLGIDRSRHSESFDPLEKGQKKSIKKTYSSNLATLTWKLRKNNNNNYPLLAP